MSGPQNGRGALFSHVTKKTTTVIYNPAKIDPPMLKSHDECGFSIDRAKVRPL